MGSLFYGPPSPKFWTYSIGPFQDQRDQLLLVYQVTESVVEGLWVEVGGRRYWITTSIRLEVDP